MFSVTEMLVNVLNICSDDELMSDGDDGLEEGNVHCHRSLSSFFFNYDYISCRDISFSLLKLFSSSHYLLFKIVIHWSLLHRDQSVFFFFCVPRLMLERLTVLWSLCFGYFFSVLISNIIDHEKYSILEVTKRSRELCSIYSIAVFYFFKFSQR